MPDSNQHVAGLLFLHAQTALHPGSGTALGVVDLPVQRERHTQWPVIPGSSLKGVLRDRCRQYTEAASPKEADSHADLVAAFGPPTDQSHEHAGAVSVTDARLLAFPVRSLRGVFAWATCGAALDRLRRDLGLAGMPPFEMAEWPEDNQALCAADSPLLLDGERLVLEEFEFQRTGDVGNVAQWIAARAVEDATQARFIKHLAILSDNDFTHFARHATEIAARIGLDYERKTVKDGALFYQEFLPAETLLYSVVFAAPSRRDNSKSASELFSYLRSNLDRSPVLQVGGDETTGKGLCAVRLVNENGAST